MVCVHTMAAAENVEIVSLLLSMWPVPRAGAVHLHSVYLYLQVVDVWDPKYINREELFLTLCRFIQHIYTK